MEDTMAGARVKLAQALYYAIKRLKPTDDEWADLAAIQKAGYISVVSDLLDERELVAAAIGASFMVPVPVLED